MKFEQMQYARPDFDAARETFASLRARIAAAPDAQAQLEAFREFETLSRHISTMSTLAEIRHTVDTRDAFYEAEREFFDANSPALGEAQLDVYRALLAAHSWSRRWAGSLLKKWRWTSSPPTRPFWS